jgi:hypothetical protein
VSWFPISFSPALSLPPPHLSLTFIHFGIMFSVYGVRMYEYTWLLLYVQFVVASKYQII